MLSFLYNGMREVDIKELMKMASACVRSHPHVSSHLLLRSCKTLSMKLDR